MPDTVSNTSPLSYLHRLGRLELLPRLFGKVLIPSEVEIELSRGRLLGFDLPDPRSLSWIEIRHATDDPFGDLGAGETGVLNLARSLTDPLVILDDGAARVWATRLGFRLTGTLGVLAEAKLAGLLPSVASDLDRLQEAGFRLTASLRAVIIATCGEG